MKNLAELLQLAQSLPPDERVKRIALIRTFSGMCNEFHKLVQKFESFNVFGAAIWMSGDARSLTESLYILISTAKDLQYRARHLLGNTQVATRKASDANPGRAILECMKTCNVSTPEMAELLGKTSEYVADLIHNRKPITVEIAKLLEEATGSSAESWLTLQVYFSLSNTREPSVDAVTKIRERFSRLK